MSGLTYDIYQLADGTLLQNSIVYYVGIRAMDAVGNEETNVVSLNATSTGIFYDTLCNVGTRLLALEALLQTDHNNFVTDNSNFEADHANFEADHANFEADHANFEADLSSLGDFVSYGSHGIFAIDNQNRFTGSLWLFKVGNVVKTSLVSAEYQIYDNTDTIVPGLSESGLSANAEGVFIITPVSAAALEPFVNYRVKITIVHSSGTYTSYRGITIGE
jgi:hypothetical protein